MSFVALYRSVALEAVPQTALTPVVTRCYSVGLLNFAAHPPEDNQRDRRCRSARLQRTRPQGPFQYRLGGYVCGDALPALVTECDFAPCPTAGGSVGYARLAVMLVCWAVWR